MVWPTDAKERQSEVQLDLNFSAIYGRPFTNVDSSFCRQLDNTDLQN